MGLFAHMLRSSCLLSIVGDEPPKAFRLFAAGWNDSIKGAVLFDAAAAASVMAAYAKHGADLMIDLEHDSLDARRVRDDMSDARGWAKLELRNGELWAVDVKWTADGDRRLREKTQRYTSPAFYTDEEDRVTEVINVAITSLPATHGLSPLVAASIGGTMDPEKVKAIIAAIEGQDTDAALGLLKDLLVDAASGGAADSAEEAPAEPADAAPMEDNALAAAADEPPKEEDEPQATSLSQVLTATGLDESAMVAEYLELRADREKRQRQEAAIELSARRELAAELVKLGYETPATAWKGDPERRVPADHLMVGGIAELRSRVKALREARGTAPVSVTPPANVPAARVQLSQSTLDEIKRRGWTVEEFEARKQAAAIRR